MKRLLAFWGSSEHAVAITVQTAKTAATAFHIMVLSTAAVHSKRLTVWAKRVQPIINKRLRRSFAGKPDAKIASIGDKRLRS